MTRKHRPADQGEEHELSDSSGVLDRAEINVLRAQYLERVQAAFSKAVDIVNEFRSLAAQHPEDVELVGLTEILCGTVKQLLNTVTCKVAANGIAADWDRLFCEDSQRGDGERTGPAIAE